jgi:hypothetical protein
MNEPLPPFWSIPAEELLRRLQTRAQRLSTEEAKERHARYAATVSLLLADRTDALIVLTIILVSALLGRFPSAHRGALSRLPPSPWLPLHCCSPYSRLRPRWD